MTLLYYALLVLLIAFIVRNIRNESIQNNTKLSHYLLDADTLTKSKKPILWLYVPREYNSRNWQSFGSRSSYDLNQPYLYLTVKSIIEKCRDSFTICIIDDSSFSSLIPNWKIAMNKLASPILENVRQLGIMKLIYLYGGLLCPISFICFKDLFGIYEQSETQSKMCVAQFINKSVSSSHRSYSPELMFMCAPKHNPVVRECVHMIQMTISTDYTAESVFVGTYSEWCISKIREGKITSLDVKLIGIENQENEPIVIDMLLGTSDIKLSPFAFGVYVPANEILNRVQYQWFARMSESQVLESNTMIGEYINQALGMMRKDVEGFKETRKPDWVGFWKTPLFYVYGLKPNYLGDNVLKVPFAGLG